MNQRRFKNGTGAFYSIMNIVFMISFAKQVRDLKVLPSSFLFLI